MWLSGRKIIFVTFLPPFRSIMQLSESHVRPSLNYTGAYYLLFWSVFLWRETFWRSNLFGHLLNEEAHDNVCAIKTEIENQCKSLFRKSWNLRHFLLGNISYVYKESDFSHEKLYLKKAVSHLFQRVGLCRWSCPSGWSLKETLETNDWNPSINGFPYHGRKKGYLW